MYIKKIFFFIFFISLYFFSCANKEERKLPPYAKIKKEKKGIPQAFCPLCGIEVNRNLALRRPLGVMIENHPQSRPQSSLDKACIVYEALAEGGITRFLALYLHNDAEVLGPIRSARPYFIDINLEYDAVFVHCGQSWEAFGKIYSLNFPTINEMWRPKAFWRNRRRHAPHNLYTNTYKLRNIIKEKHWEKPLKLSHFLFAEKFENPANSANKIIINYPFGYKIIYRFDKESKKYQRFISKKPHIDATSGKQITAKNIIIQYVPTSVFDEEGRLNMETSGEGRAIIISHGVYKAGKWCKRDEFTPTSFFDTEDNVISLSPGSIWIQIVPMETKVEIY